MNEALCRNEWNKKDEGNLVRDHILRSHKITFHTPSNCWVLVKVEVGRRFCLKLPISLGSEWNKKFW